jgi:bromodomain-containing protein 8
VLCRQSDAPGYYEIIKKPMDFKTIKAKIRDGSIANLDDMQSAMYLMFT